MPTSSARIATVTPNPAIDRTLTISGFRAGAVNRVSGDRSTPAGKGVNVAVALTAYGEPTEVTGFLGGDNDATFVSLFSRTGIVDRFIRVEGETRTGIKISDPESRQTTDINFPGIVVPAAAVAELGDRVGSIAASGVRTIVLAGSLPPETPLDLYFDLVTIARGGGAEVILDTSGAALRDAIDARPDVIKPNVHELAELLGERLAEPAMGDTAALSAILRAARVLLARGPSLVVVSMGAAGALFVDAGSCLHAHVLDVHPRSTVGAGDAMVAGIAAGRLEGHGPAALARLATAFSLHALTAEDRTAPSREEIMARAAEVRVDDVAA